MNTKTAQILLSSLALMFGIMTGIVGGLWAVDGRFDERIDKLEQRMNASIDDKIVRTVTPLADDVSKIKDMFAQFLLMQAERR